MPSNSIEVGDLVGSSRQRARGHRTRACSEGPQSQESDEKNSTVRSTAPPIQIDSTSAARWTLNRRARITAGARGGRAAAASCRRSADQSQ